LIGDIKSVLEIAPAFLKNEGRIEAFFFVYFLAILVQSLIELQLHRAMQTNDLPELDLLPESRGSKRPTAKTIFRLFALAARHTISEDQQILRIFHPELTSIQQEILDLLQIPHTVFICQKIHSP